MPFSDAEKWGITDLLAKEEQNMPNLMQLARSIIKSIYDVESVQEALDIVFTHLPDSFTLLNKRHITKEILFKYLHSKKVSMAGDLTKGVLIGKCIKYWRDNELNGTESVAAQPVTQVLEDKSPQVTVLNQQQEIQTYSKVQSSSQSLAAGSEQYPIHLMARKFAEWFFENYNKNQLKAEDFWSDSRLSLRISANDGVHDVECQSALEIAETLLSTRSQFGFFFNPNLTHSGVQGRMDVHGLVLVLVCGTLHTQQDCVGLFECTFGLLRDPFAENNWKMKTLQCLMRSKNAPALPCLEESDTLKPSLALPVPEGELI